MLAKTALIALIVAFAITGVAGAKGKGQGVKAPAVAACQAERTANTTAFQAKYANAKGKNAFKRCVAQHVRAAAKACKAERKASGKEAFRAKYGKAPMKACIRQHDGATAG